MSFGQWDSRIFTWGTILNNAQWSDHRERRKYWIKTRGSICNVGLAGTWSPKKRESPSITSSNRVTWDLRSKVRFAKMPIIDMLHNLSEQWSEWGSDLVPIKLFVKKPNSGFASTKSLPMIWDQPRTTSLVTLVKSHYFFLVPWNMRCKTEIP
jgi:hypothetical protein